MCSDCSWPIRIGGAWRLSFDILSFISVRVGAHAVLTFFDVSDTYARQPVDQSQPCFLPKQRCLRAIGRDGHS